jgi:hypothetical protein
MKNSDKAGVFKNYKLIIKEQQVKVCNYFNLPKINLNSKNLLINL